MNPICEVCGGSKTLGLTQWLCVAENSEYNELRNGRASHIYDLIWKTEDDAMAYRNYRAKRSAGSGCTILIVNFYHHPKWVDGWSQAPKALYSAENCYIYETKERVNPSPRTDRTIACWIVREY